MEPQSSKLCRKKAQIERQNKHIWEIPRSTNTRKTSNTKKEGWEREISLTVFFGPDLARSPNPFFPCLSRKWMFSSFFPSYDFLFLSLRLLRKRVSNSHTIIVLRCLALYIDGSFPFLPNFQTPLFRGNLLVYSKEEGLEETYQQHRNSILSGFIL